MVTENKQGNENNKGKENKDIAGDSISGPGCSSSIPIVPIRYAIMPRSEDNTQQYAYENSKGNLEKGFEKTKTSQYTLRTTRPGYIYLVEADSDVIRLWESDGEGNYTSLRFNSMENYGETANRGQIMSHITTTNCPHIVYIAYSSDLWTQTTLLKAEKNIDDFRELRMQRIDIGEILNGNGKISKQPHLLPATELDSMVEEYKITKKDDLKNAFEWSNYLPKSSSPTSDIKKLKDKYHETHHKKLPVIIALRDAQSITQDQGSIANLYVHQIFDLKNKLYNKKQKNPIKYKNVSIPDTMNLSVDFISKLSSDFYRKKAISDIIHALLQSTYPKKEDHPKKKTLADDTKSAKLELQRINQAKIMRARATGNFAVQQSLSQSIVSDSQARTFALTNRNVNKDAANVIDFVDYQKLTTFSDEWDRIQTELEEKKKVVLLAVADHAAWLKTGEYSQSNNPNGLAVVWNCYDRNNLFSAIALETAIALCIDGMGVPVPGMLKQDKREALLEKWIGGDVKLGENVEDISPLHIAASAFKPFDVIVKKQTSLIGFTTNNIEKAHKLFPHTFATVIVQTTIREFTLRKLRKQTRWTKSKSALRRIEKAITSGSLKQLLLAFNGRYAISEVALENNSMTKSYTAFINEATIDDSPKTTSSTNVTETSSRTAKATGKTQTTSTKTIIEAKLLRKAVFTPVQSYVAYLHIVYLTDNWNTLSADPNFKNRLQLTTALISMAGALLDLTATSIYVVENTRLKSTLPGKLVGRAAQTNLTKFITTKTFISRLNYIAAGGEALMNIIEGTRLYRDGDRDAAAYTYAGGAASLASAGLFIYAGTFSLVPGIGWVVAALLVAGFAAWLFFMAESKKDTPLQRWLSRTVLGDPRGSDIPFKTLTQELEAYFVVNHTPKKLPKLPVSEDNKIFEQEAVTGWNEGNKWLLGLGYDYAEFTIFIPGYTKNVSELEFSNIIGYDGSDVRTKEDAAKQKKSNKILENKHKLNWNMVQKPEGLYINARHYFNNHSIESASVTVTYWPNKQIADKIIKKTFFVDD